MTTALVVLAAWTSVFVLAACHRSRSARPDGAVTPDGAMPDAPVVVSDAPGADTGDCEAWETPCEATCADLRTDRWHCGSCGNECGDEEDCIDGTCRGAGTDTRTKVDLLFMVDNSNSMFEEQAALTEQFPRMLSALSTGDLDGSGGTPDFTPVTDLHLGVVTSDMGNGGYTVPTCTTTFGDDGVLRTEGNAALMYCSSTYPSFLSYSTGADPSGLARDFSCVATAGTGGCGFEQQLEAVLKALTPSGCSSSWCDFSMGTTGHGNGENAGFLRSDSILAVVLVTDENDCSARDTELFSGSEGSAYNGALNLRCFMYPSALQRVARYVDGLLALRPLAADVVFAAIVGVPTDLTTSTTRFDAILADPRMEERIDLGSSTPRLVPSCNVPGVGLAYPPRRIVEAARDLDSRGASVVVESICQSDFTRPMEAILQELAARIGR